MFKRGIGIRDPFADTGEYQQIDNIKSNSHLQQLNRRKNKKSGFFRFDIDKSVGFRYNIIQSLCIMTIMLTYPEAEMKFEQEFENYLSREKEASQATINAYLGDIREFSGFAEGRGKEAENCGSADVAAYMMSLTDAGKSSSTINRKMSSVRGYFGYLVEKGVISNNPALSIKSPRVAEKSIEYLSVKEVEDLLDAADGTDSKGLRDKALLELMYATGMRASEISSANVSDVDLRIGFISCSTDGKTRIVPIGRIAKSALDTYLGGPRGDLLRGDENNKALFVNFQGQRISRQGIWKILKYYGEKAGLKTTLNPQILRNSFAVHMVQNGADIRTIQDLLGLEDINAAKLYALAGKNRVIDVYDRTHPRA